MKLDIRNGLLKAMLSKRFHSSAQMEDNDMHMTKLGNLLRLLVAKADQKLTSPGPAVTLGHFRPS